MSRDANVTRPSTGTRVLLRTELLSENPDLAPVSGENGFNSFARSSGPELTVNGVSQKVPTGAGEPETSRLRSRGEHY